MCVYLHSIIFLPNELTEVKSPHREAEYRLISLFVILSRSGFCFKPVLKSSTTHILKICFYLRRLKEVQAPKQDVSLIFYVLPQLSLPFPPRTLPPFMPLSLSSCSYLHVMMCQLCFKHKKKLRLEKSHRKRKLAPKRKIKQCMYVTFFQ